MNDTHESEANLFALSLLMPEAWLRKDVPRPLTLMNMGARVEELAARYGVEASIMMFRLKELGLLRA